MTLQELRKRYCSIDKIKKGGQKTVYKAKRPDGDVVALKIISNSNDLRVLQEIEIVKKLGISNIPQILETGIV